MRPILEVNYRNVDKTAQIETLIEEKLLKLQEVCGDLISCRVSLEKPQQHQRAGNPFRVRLDVKVPGKEIVTVREMVAKLETTVPSRIWAMCGSRSSSGPSKQRRPTSARSRSPRGR